MAATVLPVTTLLLVVTSHLTMGQSSFNQGNWGVGFGHGAGYGGLGGMIGGSGAMTRRSLSCSAVLADGRELMVTLTETSPQGGMYGSPMSPMYGALGMSAGMSGGWGHSGGGLEMKARVKLLRNIPEAYLIVTQFAAPAPDVCTADSQGGIFSTSAQSGHSYGGYGYPGMGAMTSYMSPMLGGLGGGYMAPYGGMGMGMGVDPVTSSPSVLTRLNVMAGNSQIINVASMQGLTLDQLAGRGITVCDSLISGWHHDPVCETPMTDICCGLTYVKTAMN